MVNRANVVAFESLIVWLGGSSMLVGTIALVSDAEFKGDGTNLNVTVIVGKSRVLFLPIGQFSCNNYVKKIRSSSRRNGLDVEAWPGVGQFRGVGF